MAEVCDVLGYKDDALGSNLERNSGRVDVISVRDESMWRADFEDEPLHNVLWSHCISDYVCYGGLHCVEALKM